MLQNVELRTLLGKVGKGSVVVASSYAYQWKRMAVPGTAASSFNTHSTDV